MRAPKLWRYYRATLNGYFWLPCPLCGKMFGGHEKFGGAILVPGKDATYGRVVCVNCAARPEVLARELAFEDLVRAVREGRKPDEVHLRVVSEGEDGNHLPQR